MINREFSSLGLSESTLKIIKKKGFEEATEIQALTIPVMLREKVDIVGQARTGTGKTAAFGLPILENLEKNSGHVQCIILTPTRELALQVSEELNSLGGRKKISIVPIYGGQSMSDQLRRLKKQTDIIVGTPGRIIDHLKRGSMDLSKVSHLVMDEADEMLNMGFLEEVEEILSNVNSNRRTLLFSATMPERILEIAKKYMKEYKLLAAKDMELTENLTDQIYFEVQNDDKFEALCRIIDINEDFYSIIFTRTKVGVDELANKLMDRGYDAEGLHGDLSQYQRERVLKKFRNRRINILVATDVAARGIDVSDLSHVINYALPQDQESYIHRIGRTGRAGKKGIAISFISPSEYKKMKFITGASKTNIRKASLPKGKEIVRSKKNKIKAEINHIIKEDYHSSYIETAQKITGDHDPNHVIAALLKHLLDDELDESRYRDIRAISVDERGEKTRLFVGLGKKDSLTPKKLVKMINNRSGIPGSKIREIKVLDSFSFLSVPFREAEIILKDFAKDGEAPLIQKASPERKKKGKKSPKRGPGRQ